MAWSRPDKTLTKKRLNAAGDVLSGRRPVASPDEREEALGIINNWRSAHSWPLNAVKITLRSRAKKVDSEAIVAQRLKRLSSIDAKLRRFADMQLSRMHDIGGCRAVMATVADAEALVRVYEKADAKNPHRGLEFVKKYDYLARPKEDGYRGVHLVYRYRSTSPENEDWNGLRIEVQLRSRLQHAWATAVETVSTFTNQQLKAGVGEDDWKRFFALMGSALALRERRPLVPGTPERSSEIGSELRVLAKSLRVDAVLQGWQTAVQIFPEVRSSKAAYYLLMLDTEANTITIYGYTGEEQAKASAEYLQAEKSVEERPQLNAVLASADSIASLRSAFPNYYLDTDAFRAAVREAVKLK